MTLCRMSVRVSSPFLKLKKVFVEVGVPKCFGSDLAQTAMVDRALYNTRHPVTPC